MCMNLKIPINDNMAYHDGEIWARVEIPTADLIKELEARRPCAKCSHPCDMGGACIQECCYQPIDKANNFTPKTEEHK